MLFASKYKILALIVIIIYINSKNNDLRKINKVSIISLKINGPGTQYIFRDDSKLPNKIYINGQETTVSRYIENLNENENIITFRWENDLTDCSEIFIENSNIIEIDLSQLSTSSATTMLCMFCGLTEITSLNISHFVTTYVKSMEKMFYGCKQLTSLDLSNFDTSSVEDFSYMFKGCSKLTSLNLNNFNTIKVK